MYKELEEAERRGKEKSCTFHKLDNEDYEQDEINTLTQEAGRMMCLAILEETTSANCCTQLLLLG